LRILTLPSGWHLRPSALLLLCALGLSCSEGASPEAPVDGASPQRSATAEPVGDPVVRMPAEGSPDSAREGQRRPQGQPRGVTVARIDAFLDYQSRRLTLEASLWKELETAMPKQRRGARAAAPSRASLALLERRAAEDEAALTAVGLTRAELGELGALVREVLGPRRLAGELALEETAALLEEQAERLTGPQAEELNAQAAPLRARLNELMALEQVRLERGDASVDAVLAREEALLRWEQARLAALAGP